MFVLLYLISMQLKELSLEITQRCPNYCIHCSSCSSLTKDVTMSYDKICEIINEAKDLGLKTLCISGGEPFLHPRIVDIIRYAAIKNLNISVYTSGIYHDGIHYTSLPLRQLAAIKDCATKLIFNVEASDDAIYNSVMGTTIGGFDMLKKSIEESCRLGIMVEAHIVPMKRNYKQIH